ncbi:MAG TPA: alpha/beta hydrolase [Candidatus Saccharimonadia bacterium]|jgi:pimeloyl-ACP methyl ester carboxylesterase|nr:alpha/beta hydrolase [Candidatus Saccharimonadia bacterium]
MEQTAQSVPQSEAPATAERALAKAIGVHTKQMSVGPYSINYATAGTGPAVVLIHGANIGWGMWFPTIPELAKHFTVYALDLPGSGRSTQADFRLLEFERDYVNTVLGFIDQLGLTTVSLVGHSFGSAIAMQVALERPMLVNHLVLTSPLGFSSTIVAGQKVVGIYPMVKLVSKTALKPTHKNMAKFLRSGMVDPASLSPEFINYYHAATSESPTSQPLLFMNSLTRGFHLKPEVVLVNKLAKLTSPTLVVTGKHDKNIPLRDVHARAKRIPNATLKIFADSAHIPSIDQSREFNHLLMSFLKKKA